MLLWLNDASYVKTHLGGHVPHRDVVTMEEEEGNQVLLHGMS